MLKHPDNWRPLSSCQFQIAGRILPNVGVVGDIHAEDETLDLVLHYFTRRAIQPGVSTISSAS